MNDIVLSNNTLSLTVSLETGAVMALESRLTGWKILDRPELGLSFRLLLPLSEALRNNPVMGEHQKPQEVTPAVDGRSVRILWEGVRSERGGWHDIGVELLIRVDDEAAIFSMTIDNRTNLVVENVYCPYLGDVQAPASAAWLKTFLYWYAGAQEWGIRPNYQNLRGYYGSDFPVQFSQQIAGSGTPMAPYILVRSPAEGLYVGVDKDTTELVAWNTELRPGFESAIDGRVPRGPAISGHDVAVRFAAVHVPYIAGGERRSLSPVALAAYSGTWHRGVDIYKRRLARNAGLPRVPAWAREPHSWLQLHINSPEDELRTRFSDLPRVGEECARHGVRAIQLVGWNDGGQDQGNPSHDPDPRLGTFDELRDAIRAIQAAGVKVVLFAKFTWADRATQWFRTDLKRLAIKDPYGDYYLHPGYQYQTATQFLDINTKRLVPMCFLSEDYMALCERELGKILDLGADGLLFDECLHHGPALLCFDAGHGHRIGAPVYAADNLLIQRFSAITSQRNPDFLFAGEACYDREMAVYHLSYHRSEDRRHVPLSRYALPRGQYMTAITGFNDRVMVNQSLLYRYILSYEPFNFKGRLEDFPLTVAYGRKMDALRTELRAYFWDGEFRGEIGATVEANGERHHPYAVFHNTAANRLGLVICNDDAFTSVTVTVVLEGGGKLVRYRLVDGETWESTAAGITIPPSSAAVVI